MSHYITFNVVSTGDIADGMDSQEVQQRLVKGLRLVPEQAKVFFDKRRVLKQGLSKSEAESLGARLARLGVVVEIEKVQPQLKQSTGGLTLELQDDHKPQAPGAALSLEPMHDEEAEQGTQSSTIQCPKCDHEQPRSEQCEQCGIWFHKVEQSLESENAGETAVAAETATMAVDDSDESVSDSELSPKAMAAAAGAAVLGALIWQFVAVTFDYELGIIAWAIGGAVGLAAASFGSQGVKAGVICGFLAFASIGFGKYWAAQSFMDQFQQSMASVVGEDADFSEFYEEVVEDAAIFAEGSGSEEFTRQFMIDREYSEATDPADISREELQQFREYNEPELREVAQNQPDYAQWKADTLGELSAISPWELVKEGLGILDILFLLFGVGTAFRLASRMD